jgi:diadenylate cyclase
MPIDITLPIQFHGILSTIGWFDIIDILIVGTILYKVYEMLQDTRAITLVKGILVLLAVTIVCSWAELHVISWLLQKAVTLLFVALPIVFQPELRRALEHLGQGTFLGSAALLDDDEARTVVSELTRAVKQLSSTRTGALLVIERNMGLNDVSATGIHIDGLISADFLLNVFIVNTPLHDGAAVIRGNRLIAAGCLLPLTENRTLSTELGTRHRAAIGLSEQCDALVVVVSEETGTISVAENGHIMRHLDAETLKAVLMPAFASPKTSIKDRIRNWRAKK